MEREALLQDGLEGLVGVRSEASQTGIWRYFDPAQQAQDLRRVNGRGRFQTNSVFGLKDYLGGEEATYDSQIGSIGGGNHFVEVQKVARIGDAATAYAWGLKPGMVVIMVHSGSVSLGHFTGFHFQSAARAIYPSRLPIPRNMLFPLPESEQHRKVWNDFWTSLANSANFAYGNRLFLGLMMRQALFETAGPHHSKLLYDTGHNMIWPEPSENGYTYLHRKGACPARGPGSLPDTDFAYSGEPVLIPGSMGASSYVLAGTGSEMALQSASHGAERALSRGEAARGGDAELDAFLNRFRVVTPLDTRKPEVRQRRDILSKWREELKREAPWAYKDVTEVVETQTGAGIGKVVAELQPILTVKG